MLAQVARRLVGQLEKRIEKRPAEEYFAQFVEVPNIRTALALNHGDTTTAMTYIEPGKPFDRANPSSRLRRADTLLRAGRLKDAASEFGAVASFPFGASIEAAGSLWICYTVNMFGPLADVGLARSRRLAGDIAGSRRAYDEFFVAWKDADPDIPILQQAKAEYAELQ